MNDAEYIKRLEEESEENWEEIDRLKRRVAELQSELADMTYDRDQWMQISPLFTNKTKDEARKLLVGHILPIGWTDKDGFSQNVVGYKEALEVVERLIAQNNLWRDVATDLKVALEGCSRRLQSFVALAAGDSQPDNVPSALDNIHTIAAAMESYGRLIKVSDQILP